MVKRTLNGHFISQQQVSLIHTHSHSRRRAFLKCPTYSISVMASATTPPPVVDTRTPCYGPLTTIFTPPSSCFSNYYYESGDGYMLGAPFAGFIRRDECLPSQYFNASYGFPVAWYSPGVCPSGYTSVHNATTGDPFYQSTLYTNFSPKITEVPGETTVWCCPK